MVCLTCETPSPRVAVPPRGPGYFTSCGHPVDRDTAEVLARVGYGPLPPRQVA